MIEDNVGINARTAMTAEMFERTLRSFVRHSPFQPFVMELEEGRQILIDDPEAVAFNGSGAGYIGPEEIYMIASDRVRAIHPAHQDQEKAL